MAFVVYTMGKVGSRAIDLGLEHANVKAWHIHTLDPALIQWHLNRSHERENLPPGHVCTSMYLMQRKLRDPVYISCVRDPVARNLSAFFQNLPDYVADPASADPQYVLDRFIEEYKHDIPLTWFDREWKAYLGIDIYAEPPAHDEKMLRGANWIVLKPEANPAFKSELFSELAGRPVKITLVNEGEKKEHAALYTGIKQRARMKPDLADRIYDSPFVRQFWSPAERERMHRQWTETDADAAT